MTKRTCGTCSLCCKLRCVRELNQSIDTWCKHASPGRCGCLIYPDRPSSCRGFICGWLSGAEIGDEWFPARCKMFIMPRPSEGLPKKKGILVTVDPAYPNKFRTDCQPAHAGFMVSWLPVCTIACRGFSYGCCDPGWSRLSILPNSAPTRQMNIGGSGKNAAGADFVEFTNGDLPFNS